MYDTNHIGQRFNILTTQDSPPKVPLLMVDHLDPVRDGGQMQGAVSMPRLSMSFIYAMAAQHVKGTSLTAK